MGKRNLFIIPILVAFWGYPITYAGTEIYKYIDEHGRVTYINKPIRGGKKLLTTPSVPKSTHKKTQTHKHFPKVHANTQKKRDLKRRQILENELAAETKLLADKQRVLSNMRASVKTLRTNIKQPNHARIQQKEKIKKIQDKVLLHERNIVALKKELANL